jgi:hypothetical protein
MSLTRVNGEWKCPAPASDNIEEYLQKCPMNVVAAEPPEYAPVVGNEEEVPLKCYKLDADEDVIDDTVYINGEGKPAGPTEMMRMQKAIDGLDPSKPDPGLQPGDLERIGSYALAIFLSFIIICTISYYAISAYKQPGGSFMKLVDNWRLRMPHWWWCPPSSTNVSK